MAPPAPALAGVGSAAAGVVPGSSARLSSGNGAAGPKLSSPAVSGEIGAAPASTGFRSAKLVPSGAGAAGAVPTSSATARAGRPSSRLKLLETGAKASVTPPRERTGGDAGMGPAMATETTAGRRAGAEVAGGVEPGAPVFDRIVPRPAGTAALSRGAADGPPKDVATLTAATVATVAIPSPIAGSSPTARAQRAPGREMGDGRVRPPIPRGRRTP